MACDGDSAESCGAGWRLNVWSKGGVIPVSPTVVPSVDGYNYTGCYTEATDGRALAEDYFRDDAMTVEACEAFCSPAYTIFGVEYAYECYCGDSLEAGSVLTAETDCNTACGGNATELCGGSNRLNVYTYST